MENKACSKLVVTSYTYYICIYNMYIDMFLVAFRDSVISRQQLVPLRLPVLAIYPITLIFFLFHLQRFA